MNRKQFIFVLLALFIIGGAGLVLLNQNKQSWAVHEAKVGDKLLPDLRPNEVAAIHIKGASDLHIVQTNGLWQVRERGDYPANYQQVRGLLLKIRDVKVAQSEQIGPSQLARVDLEPEGPHQGTLLEFIDRQGKVLDAVHVGKMHLRHRDESGPFGLRGLFDGRYVVLPGKPENVLLISDDLPSVTPEPSLWLSKEFFKFENVKFISLFSTNAANSWELVRETESWPWSLVAPRPGEELDTKIASEIVEMLHFLTFVDILPTPLRAPSETGMDKPILLTILTFDRFAYTLKIGVPPQRKQDAIYYLSVAVSANLSSERPPGAGPETADEQKKLDEEFQNKTRKLREKLARESQLAHRVFTIESQLIEPLMRERARLLETKTLVSEKAQ